GDELLEAIKALSEKMRVLAAILHHPCDEGLAALPGRQSGPGIRLRHVGQRRTGGERRGPDSRAQNERAPVHEKPHGDRLISASPAHASSVAIPIRSLAVSIWRIPDRSRTDPLPFAHASPSPDGAAATGRR